MPREYELTSGLINNNLSRIARQFPRRSFARVKEIVLIRDPRDLYCSQVAYFHSKRDAVLRTVIGASDELLRISSEASDDVIFVRYQDLLSGDVGEIRRLSEFLGVEIVPHAADEREGRIFATHSTSVSPEATVDRWRRELDAETVAIIEQNCGELLHRFGFSTAHSQLYP